MISSFEWFLLIVASTSVVVATLLPARGSHTQTAAVTLLPEITVTARRYETATQVLGVCS